MHEFSLGLLTGALLGVFVCLLALNAYLLRNNLAVKARKKSQEQRTTSSEKKASMKKGTVPLPDGLAMTSGTVSSNKKGSDS